MYDPICEHLLKSLRSGNIRTWDIMRLCVHKIRTQDLLDCRIPCYWKASASGASITTPIWLVAENPSVHGFLKPSWLQIQRHWQIIDMSRLGAPNHYNKQIHYCFLVVCIIYHNFPAILVKDPTKLPQEKKTLLLLNQNLLETGDHPNFVWTHDITWHVLRKHESYLLKSNTLSKTLYLRSFLENPSATCHQVTLPSSLPGNAWKRKASNAWNAHGTAMAQDLRNITLLGTNISHQKSLLKMMFLFPRWDMLVPWRVNNA